MTGFKILHVEELPDPVFVCEHCSVNSAELVYDTYNRIAQFRSKETGHCKHCGGTGFESDLNEACVECHGSGICIHCNGTPTRHWADLPTDIQEEFLSHWALYADDLKDYVAIASLFRNW